MTTAALALVAAAVALVATAVVATMVVRTRRASEEMVTRGLLEMGEQMDALAVELARTVEKVREDAQRAQILESLEQALDLEEVLARAPEAAASLQGVAGAIVRVEVGGESLAAAAGLGVGEIPSEHSPSPGAGTPGAVGGPPDGSRVRAVGISYHYPLGGAAQTSMRSAIAVPLETAAGVLGFLTVFGRDEEPPVAGSEFQTLEAIAERAGPAIETARRRRATRPETETDELTGLGNRHLLHETLALEVARAHRHGRRLAVCILDIDDFKLVNSRVGQIEGDALLVELADVVRTAIRPADLPYRSGGDEFAVILIESGRIDAEGLFARVQATLRRRPLSRGPVLSLSAGVAELKPDDDGVSLFARAEQGLHRAKEAGKGTAA